MLLLARVCRSSRDENSVTWRTNSSYILLGRKGSTCKCPPFPSLDHCFRDFGFLSVLSLFLSKYPSISTILPTIFASIYFLYLAMFPHETYTKGHLYSLGSNTSTSIKNFDPSRICWQPLLPPQTGALAYTLRSSSTLPAPIIFHPPTRT